MDTWPSGLQQKFNVAGFKKQFGSTTVRSEMDVGVAKVRSRYTKAVDVYTCTVNLDFEDYTDFDTFFKTTLANGSLRFEHIDPFTEAPAVFRFQQPPGVTPLGGRVFQIDMVWEKMP